MRVFFSTTRPIDEIAKSIKQQFSDQIDLSLNRLRNAVCRAYGWDNYSHLQLNLAADKQPQFGPATYGDLAVRQKLLSEIQSCADEAAKKKRVSPVLVKQRDVDAAMFGKRRFVMGGTGKTRTQVELTQMLGQFAEPDRSVSGSGKSVFLNHLLENGELPGVTVIDVGRDYGRPATLIARDESASFTESDDDAAESGKPESEDFWTMGERADGDLWDANDGIVIPSFDADRDDIAFTGRCRIVADSNRVFGGEDSKPFRSDILDSPTWNDLVAVAEAQIKVTRDEHHIFLADVDETEEQPEPGITQLKLVMES